MISGKRPWNEVLKTRYETLVGTIVVPSSNNKWAGMDGNTRLLSVKDSNGGAEEARTPDPLLAKQVLSQLSYSPAAKTWTPLLRLRC